MAISELDQKLHKRSEVASQLAFNSGGDYTIVGTSFYSENFAKLASIHRLRNSGEIELPVVLRHNPENKKSPSRCAIEVYSSRLLLGHIPESAAPVFADLLSNSSGLARAMARIWFDSAGYNSVALKTFWPPYLDYQEPPKLKLLYLPGDETFSFQMRTSKYPIDWERLEKLKKAPRVLDVGESIIGEDGTLTIGEFGRSPYFSCEYGYIAKPLVRDEPAVSRYLAGIGGQGKVRYKLIRVSANKHTLYLDWNLKPFDSKSYPSGLSDADIETAQISQSFPPLRWPEEKEIDHDIQASNYIQITKPGPSKINSRSDRVKIAQGLLVSIVWMFLAPLALLGLISKSLSKPRRGK